MSKNSRVVALKVLITSVIMVASCIVGTGCQSVRSKRIESSDYQKNHRYVVVKRGARGESDGFTLLQIVPLKSPRLTEAEDNLYASAGEDLTHRNISLDNEIEENMSINYILFTLTKKTLIANIIEFTGQDYIKDDALKISTETLPARPGDGNPIVVLPAAQK